MKWLQLFVHVKKIKIQYDSIYANIFNALMPSKFSGDISQSIKAPTFGNS
jgi:hypothetical protein